MAVDFGYLLGDCDLRVETKPVVFRGDGGVVTFNLPLQHNSRGHLIKVVRKVYPVMLANMMEKGEIIEHLGSYLRTVYNADGGRERFTLRALLAVPAIPAIPRVARVAMVARVARVAPPAVVAPPPQRFDEGVLSRLRPFIAAGVEVATEASDVPGLALLGAVVKEEICPISWEPVKNETVCLTNCGHFFKQEALGMWRAESNLCPVCRATICVTVRIG
jgi:hypothetical protein